MKSVIETCQPRPEILHGTFNPEVFTAALGPVLRAYRTGTATIDTVYTDAITFFRDATYPTQGMKATLTDVFRRIAGDSSVPAIHRLETGFGGGKTHTLIACTHIAFRGKALAGYTDDLLPESILPEAGTVSVVGVAGDELAVHQTRGESLRPYTLWGEIAYQIGGEELYRALGESVTSPAAPGSHYYEQVLANRRVLLMLDELAQYAARLEAAHADASAQLAAFLMGLHTYARNHPGISIVITLAGASDAFANQTERLKELLEDVRGSEISGSDAVSIAERASRDIASVVARDATQVTPVQANELSAVLAKRLFLSVDQVAAQNTVEEYHSLYQLYSAYLPEAAAGESYRARMQATYPFHPTLIDFLNQKLASAENFQGTRGVLRVLALAVRHIWQAETNVPMIHTCHLDLRSERVINEILNRTNSSDLMPVLNADIGSVETALLQGGKSNAELADERNLHPYGYPFYRYTWQTVFLHSLVGRSQGLTSHLFGISQPDCLLAVSMPNLPPAQVETALEEIKRSAYYLRMEQERYFAATEPTLNSILARIRQDVNNTQIQGKIRDNSYAQFKGQGQLFQLALDVEVPEDIPDSSERPVLAVVSAWLKQIDVEALIKTKGDNLARRYQNHVLVLIPSFVEVTRRETEQIGLTLPAQKVGQREQQELIDSARRVVAIDLLRRSPQSYGVRAAQLGDREIQKQFAAEELEFDNRIARAYSHLYYPATNGQIMQKSIGGAAIESGAAICQDIFDKLTADSELLTNDSIKRDVLLELAKLFFHAQETISLQKLKNNFAELRQWPILHSADVFTNIVRQGVERSLWCVYRMDDAQSTTPSEIYDQDKALPLGMDWLLQAGYSLVSVAGAKQRGWVGTVGITTDDLVPAVYDAVRTHGQVTVGDLKTQLNEKFGSDVEQIEADAIIQIARSGEVHVLRPDVVEGAPPNLLSGHELFIFQPQEADELLTPARAAELGLISEAPRAVRITGHRSAENFHKLMARLGSIYQRGAKSVIDQLELSELDVQGAGTITVALRDIKPDAMDQVGELLAMLAGISQVTEDTELHLTIRDPQEDAWWAELDK